MGFFNIFKKSNKNDTDIKEGNTVTQTPIKADLTTEEIKKKAEKDLAKLKNFENKIQNQEDVRTTNKQDNAITERPEEQRAREALSINNPFRGV